MSVGMFEVHGITPAGFKRLNAKQGGLCAICSRSQTGNCRKRHLNIDHCHKTKKTRGLLCDKCNIGIGLFGDDTKLLHRAINYLMTHRQTTPI